MRAVFVAASAVFLCAPASGVFLRSGAAPNATNASATPQPDAGKALEAVMSMVGSIEAQSKPPHVASTHQGNGSQHAKLDFGFTGYEQNLTQLFVATVHDSTPAPRWTNATRAELLANVTANASANFKQSLQALKQSVGKTWMALPEDEQKDAFVLQLRGRFEHEFEKSLDGIRARLKLTSQRLIGYANDDEVTPSQLLARSEQTLADVAVSDHCFSGDDFMQIKGRHSEFSLLELTELEDMMVAPNSSQKSGRKKLHAFCLPSAYKTLVKHLNDVNGIVSMSMRFEAGAMDLVQKTKTGVKTHQ